MFACEVPPFRSIRVLFAPLLPRGATRREARRGLAALTITDDRRVDAGTAVCHDGGAEVRDDNYK